MANYYNKDLYKTLGLGFEATTDEIKASYRKLVHVYHPDVAGNKFDSAKFKEIQEAYEILTNAEKRRKYDALHGFFKERIKKEFKTKTTSKTNYNEYIKKARKKAEQPESFSKSINDALDNLFNSSKPKNEQQSFNLPKNGEDINIDLTISMPEAMNGTSRKVNILHTQPCPHCEGRRFINEAQCQMCNGTGQLSLQKKINVKIPKGVTQGAKVRVKKEGNKGLNGGKDGDLYLIINIEKSHYFETEGLNIICNLPITPFEAVLGADVPINLHGSKITVKIPPMTSSGQKLRIAEAGLEDKAKTKKGDLIINVLIKLPKELSACEKSLYEKLKTISTADIRSEMNNG